MNDSFSVPESAPSRIYLSAPDMSRQERAALIEAFDSNWIAPVGPALSSFEQGLAERSGTAAAVALTSGTAALHLGLLALGVGPGDTVLVPTVTFVASANAVTYCGAVPYFVDCRTNTGNLDPDSLVKAIEDLVAQDRIPAAVMTVDLYGNCPDYGRIRTACDRYNIPILEDAAEALGSAYGDEPAGSLGDLGVFSFNGNKIVTTGGGGALVGDQDLIDKARHLAGQGRVPALHFEHDEIGFAYRMSNILAAIGIGQLDRLDEMIARTRAIHERYANELGDIDGVQVAPQNAHGLGNGWLTVLQLDTSAVATPSALCAALQRDNIEARPTWKPMHLQPIYRSHEFGGGVQAEKHFETGLCLPSGSAITDDQQARVLRTLRKALTNETAD